MPSYFSQNIWRVLSGAAWTYIKGAIFCGVKFSLKKDEECVTSHLLYFLLAVVLWTAVFTILKFHGSWIYPNHPKLDTPIFDLARKSLRALQLNCLCHGSKGTRQLLHPLLGIVHPDKCGQICSTGDHLWSKTSRTIQRSICNHGQIISGCDTTNALPSPYLWHRKPCVKHSLSG